MLTIALRVDVDDGATVGFAVSPPFVNVPNGMVVRLLNIRHQVDVFNVEPLEAGIYIDGRGLKPAPTLNDDPLTSKRWGQVEGIWGKGWRGVFTPLNPLIIMPGATLTGYLLKNAAGDASVVMVCGYDYIKVTDEVIVGLRRKGGVVESF
jgi:hypothetical protein